MLARPGRKSRVIEDQSRAHSLLFEFKSNNGKPSWLPRDLPPCLHDPLIRHQLDLPAYDVAAKQTERSTRFAADLRRLGFQLLRVRQSLIDSLWTCLKHRLLMNRFRRM